MPSDWPVSVSTTLPAVMPFTVPEPLTYMRLAVNGAVPPLIRTLYVSYSLCPESNTLALGVREVAVGTGFTVSVLDNNTVFPISIGVLLSS